METPEPPFLEEITEEAETLNASRWSGLSVRIASSVVLALAFAALLSAGGWLFSWFVIIAALMMMREWSKLTEKEESLLRFTGLFYVSIPCASIIWLRNVKTFEAANAGMHLVLFIILCVVLTDIGAYFAGRQFGKHKLAPGLSPGKTWEGLGGGALAAGIMGALGPLFSPFPITFLGGFALGVVIALFAQAGDLFESWLKRRAGVKDSGTLIPGHGGILDRVDGLAFTLPLYAMLVAMSGIL